MSHFIEVYQLYNDLLIANLGLDWYEVEKVNQHIGNGQGTYPDVAVLLERFVARDDVQSIVEFGAGASTLYLGKAAQKYHKHLRSYEELDHWLDIAQTLLDLHSIPVEIELYEKGMDIAPADLIFLDSGIYRREMPSLHSRLFEECQYLLVDDCEDRALFASVMRFMSHRERFNVFMFNPVGRYDRTVFINTKNNDFDIHEWIWSWRPDTAGWRN